MTTATVVKTPTGLEVRFDTQTLPRGSWVVAFMKATEQGVTIVTSGYEARTPEAQAIIAWAERVLLDDETPPITSYGR